MENPTHPDDLDCAPNKPIDVILFFTLNYLAHAATLCRKPGRRSLGQALSIILAILNPVAGLITAWSNFEGYMISVGSSNELEEAAAYGALLCVHRGPEWRLRASMNMPGLDPHDCRTSRSKEVGAVLATHWSDKYRKTPKDLNDVRIHGNYSNNLFEEGYELVVVPPLAMLESTLGKVESPIAGVRLASNKDAMTYVGGAIQVLFAIYSIYDTSGPQVAKFGYAAYGFTVINYAVMSIVNSIARAMSKTYPAMFMVRSDVMDEAETRGVIFDGVVGRLVAYEETFGAESIPPCGRITYRNKKDPRRNGARIGYSALGLLIAAPAFIAISVISHWQPASSTITERVLIMMWIFSSCVLLAIEALPERVSENLWVAGFAIALVLVSGVAGLATVGMEMTGSDNCVKRP